MRTMAVDKVGALVRAYQQGRVERETLVRAALRRGRSVDVLTRTMDYGEIERKIGEHVCEFWGCPDGCE